MRFMKIPYGGHSNDDIPARHFLLAMEIFKKRHFIRKSICFYITIL